MHSYKCFFAGAMAIALGTAGNATNLSGRMTVDNVFNAYISTDDTVI